MDRLQRLGIFFSPPTMSSTIEILRSAFCFSWLTLPAEFIAQQGSHNALLGTHSICYSGEAIDSQNFTIRRQSRPSFESPNPNAPAAHILPFTGKADSSKSAGYLQLLRKRNHVNRVHGLKPVTPVAGDQASSQILSLARNYSKNKSTPEAPKNGWLAEASNAPTTRLELTIKTHV